MNAGLYFSNESDYILVAEDSPVQAKRLQFFFEKHSINSIFCKNGAEALDQALQEKPVLIISDIMMPVMNGYEFCLKIKEVKDLEEVPVILLTSLNNPLDIIKGLQAGADNFITKPYDEEYLLTRIRYLLANRYIRSQGAPDTGIDIMFQGERFHINSSKKQILDLLLSVYEAAMNRNTQLIFAQQQLQKLNNDLQSANHELESFAHTVSHDLKSPLNSVLGFAELIKDEYQNVIGSEGNKYIDWIINSGKGMSELIEQLLEFSRSKKVDISPENVNISELAAKIAENLQEASYTVNYDIRIQEGMTANADPGLMKIVLQNLLSNAMKYSSKTESPEIVVAQGHENGKNYFYVQDNGVGFDMTKACNLLKPFTRLHPGKDYSGSGVGLSTVNRIIERHGGTVWFESEPGQGSTFYFSLE